MTARHLRRGTSVIELLVVLVLLVPVLAIGALAIRRILTTEAELGTMSARASAIADALQTIARHVRVINPQAGDLHAATGSTLDITTTIGVTAVCRVRGDTLYVTSGSESSAWAGTLPRSVTATDAVRLWDEGGTSWIARGVKAVAASALPCGEPHAPWPGIAAQRLLLSDSTPGLRPGALVRVVERERWTLALSGDGRWSLMLADWNPITSAFAVAQPFLAPLAPLTSPTGAGVLVRARDASGAVLAAGSLSSARLIDVILRSAPHARYGSITDSVRVDVGTP